eukprot:7494475-Prorocentrum_lima.AAC.1
MLIGQGFEKEGQTYPSDNNPVTVWYNYMKEKHSPKVECWPKVGCGAMKDGNWEACMADRFPE